jgi:hypothetical protein
VDSIALLVWVLVIFLVIYALSAAFWIFEAAFLSEHRDAAEQSFEWNLDDVQIRIATVDAEAVVQATVDALPTEVESVHVLAEEPMDVSDAVVHVVPDEFECSATHKGRALEWGRLNIPSDYEYILHLDEDTLVSNFRGLPDADIVQFSEMPMYTGSRLTYLCEIFRVGFMYEQYGFPRLKYPLYLWGGGVAIRRSIEDKVTWDRRSVTEDTNFIWHAASGNDFSFQLVDSQFRNQAPSSVTSLLKQRRRWMSGTWQDMGLLPTRYRLLLWARLMLWVLSPVALILSASVFFVPEGRLVLPFYGALSFLTFLFLHFISGLGSSVYNLSYRPLAVALAFTMLGVTINSFGGLWGIFAPVSNFAVTEKVSPVAIEANHPGLEEGDLTAHDGTQSLDIVESPLELSFEQLGVADDD